LAHAGEDADAYDGREHGEPDPREQRVEAAVLGFADDEALAGEDESPGGQRTTVATRTPGSGCQLILLVPWARA
jgi:hypothetical protein